MESSFKETMNIRRITIAVIAALTLITGYQLYWLAQFYGRQANVIRRRIMTALTYSDYTEIAMRMEKISAKGETRGTVGLTLNAANEKDSTQTQKVKQSKTIFDNHSEQTADSSSAGHRYSYATKVEFDSLDVDNSPLVAISETLMRGIHQQLDPYKQPDLRLLDSLFSDRLRKQDLFIPHKIEWVDATGTPADSVESHGFHSPRAAELYNYLLDDGGAHRYVLITEPLRGVMLRQMSGMLVATVLLLITVGFIFWYLLRTMMRMKTLDEMKTDFTNNMMHELKTPISVAYAATDAMLNYGVCDDKQKMHDYLHISEQQLNQLTGLVEQVLTMSMDDRQHVGVNLTDVDVRNAVEPLIRLHRLKADKPADIKLDIAPEGLTVRADQQHLSSMVSNLIDNAIKYSPGSADVTITCRQGEIAVADRGMGIAHDRLPFVFDKFYRVPHGNLHDVKGYGLGLFYVRNMMYKFGGSVSVESTPGKGSTFKLHFNG